MTTLETMLTLTESETNDLRAMKARLPFRAWFAVKPAGDTAMIVDSRRKANKLAKEYAPAAIYSAQ